MLILSGGIIMTACKKDKEMPSNSVFNPHDDEVVMARIKSFNKLLQQKHCEPMNVSDAIWNIEAALNYNYCHIELHYGNTYEDSIFIEYSLNNGKLDFDDVKDTYQQAEIKLHSLFKKKNYHAIVIDVQPLNTSNLFKAKISFVVGDGVVKKNVSFPNNFGPNDNWRWGCLNGNCNGSGVGIDDACTQLTYWLNSSYSYKPGQYFTNIEDIKATPNFLNPNDPVHEDNYLDYLIYINRKFGSNQNLLPNYVNTLNPGYCISYQEMNIYRWSYRTILISSNANGGIKPENKNIIWSRVNSRFNIHCDSTSCYVERAYHELKGRYGILHVVNNR